MMRCRAVSFRLFACAAALVGITLCAGCKSVPANDVTEIVEPSNDRNWKPYLATLATAEVHGDNITVHNVRNCTYITADDYIVDHYDKDLQISDVQSVDFVVVPFKHIPTLAHTWLNFGMADGTYIGVSVECRLEEDEFYAPLTGVMRQFELVYVVADERDLVRLRTNYRGEEVYLYPLDTTVDTARRLLLNYVARINELERDPAWYNAATHNCTTTIRHHMEAIGASGPWDYRFLMNGRIDELAYELGVIDTSLPFAETRERSNIVEQANRANDDPEFSVRIREGLPGR